MVTEDLTWTALDKHFVCLNTYGGIRASGEISTCCVMMCVDVWMCVVCGCVLCAVCGCV